MESYYFNGKPLKKASDWVEKYIDEIANSEYDWNESFQFISEPIEGAEHYTKQELDKMLLDKKLNGYKIIQTEEDINNILDNLQI